MINMEETERSFINPLTLAIGLIIITISIAAVLSYWASTISQGNSQPKCSGIDLRFYSGDYDSSTGVLSIVIENPNNEDYKDLRLYLFYPDNQVEQKELSVTLKSNGFKNLHITDVESGFSGGKIKTECSNIDTAFNVSNGELEEVFD